MLDATRDGEATDVEAIGAEHAVVGWVETTTGEYDIFHYDTTSGGTTTLQIDAKDRYGTDLNSDDLVAHVWSDPGAGIPDRAGLWDQVGSTVTNLHPAGGYARSQTLALSDNDWLCGWVRETTTTKAAVWSSSAVLTEFQVDTGSEQYARDLNDATDGGSDAPEVVISASGVDDGADSGAWIWKKNAGASGGGSHDLDDIVRFPADTATAASTDTMHRAIGVSGNLWIAGSFLDGGSGNPQPCVLVPYDVDNDGVPDYRQIMDGSSGDDGLASGSIADNWIPDEFEGMRVGLHAPGWDSADIAETEVIANNQVVRMPLTLTPTGDVTSGCTGYDGLDRWTNAGGTGQREAVIWLISEMNSSDTAYDYLPGAPEIRGDVLENVAEFGYLFARCMDYLQVGNESFVSGGAGESKFRAGELAAGEPSSPTAYSALSGPNKSLAVEAVLTWQSKILEHALHGSALAGRPLRFVSNATSENRVTTALSTGGEARATISSIVDFCNAHHAAFDLHLHYKDVSTATSALEGLADPAGTGLIGLWSHPRLVCSLEWGPKLDTTKCWWSDSSTGRKLEYPKYFESNYDPLHPPEIQWEELIDEFENDSTQFGTRASGDFELDVMLGDLESAGYGIVCYGPTISRDESAVLFNLASLWAKTIHEDTIDDAGKYTPMRGLFESAASGHQLSNFEPHPDPCNCPPSTP